MMKNEFLHADNVDWLDCADAQADLSLRWAHISEGAFSHLVAHTNFFTPCTTSCCISYFNKPISSIFRILV